MSTRLLLATVLLLPLAAGPGAAPAIPNDEASVTHALSRLTFGARPGDVERVTRMGLAAWIDSQLDPAAIDDDAVQGRLARLETLSLDAATIARDYIRPARQERRQALERAGREGQGGEPAMAPGSEEPGMRGERGEPGAATPGRGRLSEAQQRGRQVLADLTESRILRAVYSERQLEEVLVDFWFNHFNVFAGKGAVENYITEYERDVIRPHVLGRFRDLLGATATSAAMLFYLDNWQSRAGAINENYARELVELHTLGVDGGYTQADVEEIARAFTGWTLRGPGGAATYRAGMHDNGSKTVLGHTLPAGGGAADADRVLDIVAAHPATARHIATELAQRFVSDEPPAALVDRAAATFTRTGGDLRAVVRVIVSSPEFFADEARQAKVKTPFEFVTSAIRATGATMMSALPLGRTLRDLGMPLFMCVPPTGYDETAGAWLASGALVARLNFATELAHNRLRGVRVTTDDPDALAERLGSPAFQRQ
ncbi:MAG: DUF1800 domain-containing protein [Vicinamibacterales bacterium]